MANILYLVHRLPYPPNKGDKVRSFHLLKHLAAQHRVFLGAFIDDPEDEASIGDLPQYCADLHLARISPRTARLTSLRGLLTREALTLPYYRNAELQAWVNRTLRLQRIDAAVVFSSAMGQYLHGIPPFPLVVDFVDLDSAKWTQYAARHRWPMSWLYRREGERLLAYERALALRATHSFFVTDNEAGLFLRSAPECIGRVEAMCNGVDAEFFSPAPAIPSPFIAGEVPLVFTGAMDYWPNIDAVRWFAEVILPRLLQFCPQLRFYIVGRNPAAEVLALDGERVAVTGTVDDVRPYLQHAAVVVAPLRIARGIQNKVLEAMAMGKAVVASSDCAGAVDAVPGRDFLTAGSVDEYCRQIEFLLRLPERAAAIGLAARQQVLARYSWEAHLSRIDPYLDPGNDRRLDPVASSVATASAAAESAS